VNALQVRARAECCEFVFGQADDKRWTNGRLYLHHGRPFQVCVTTLGRDFGDEFSVQHLGPSPSRAAGQDSDEQWHATDEPVRGLLVCHAEPNRTAPQPIPGGAPWL
jgi:hypothetical protein